MRTSLILTVGAILLAGFHSKAQHRTELNPGYYVVVGAYAPNRENVAQNYTEVLNRRGYKAAYGFNSSRNYFFVYLKYFTELKTSLSDMENTRKEGEFAQAWVRVIPGDISVKAEQKKPVPIEQAQPVKQEPLQSAPVVGQVTNASTETSAVHGPPPAPAETVVVAENPPIRQYEKITLGNTEVFLSLFNATNNRIVEGNVKVIDTDRTKLLKEVKGNEYMLLPDPKNQSGQLTLICEAFGYRKIQQEINYPLPLADTVKDYVDLMGTTFVLNFDLVRYHAGDIATLYNVYFYNDAAIMLPESKYELNSLLQMMQENPKYRIKLHGHSNGNYHGRIVKLGENKNFFSLTGAKETMGSAKDLSYERAEVIKEYLQVNGVDPLRVEVKAWGGKRPLYDKHSVNAKKNVRVEVEIISE
jgi:outer membrane protein OmpA-like peptidoglycan-associated protein